MKATSISLSEKFKKLNGSCSSNSPHGRLNQGTAVDEQAESMASSLPSQLWSHLQKSLLARPAPSLQPFTTCDAVAADAQVSEEILAPVDLLCRADAAPSSTIDERKLGSCVGDDTKEVRPPTPSSVQRGLLQDYETADDLSEEHPIALEDDLLLDATPVDERRYYRDADCEDLHLGASVPIRSPNYATLESLITSGLATISHTSADGDTLIQSEDVDGQSIAINRHYLLEQDS